MSTDSGVPPLRLQPPGALDLFHEHYGKVFGARWPALFEALKNSDCKVHRQNIFSLSATGARAIPELFLEHAFEFHNEGVIRDSATGLLQTYVMDPASIYGAQALNVQDGDRVLDMCAAPGGKSLILAEALQSSGQLVANEVSHPRRSSLIKVIQDYLPMKVRERVFVTGWEAGALGANRRGQFERVLLDAPCSGERFLLRHPKKMALWSPSKSKRLALRQYALLTSALEAGRPGARIVYSTCAMTPLENDGVIEKLLNKKKGRVRVASGDLTNRELSLAESTRFGFQFLPDRHGLGPFYFCAIEII